MLFEHGMQVCGGAEAGLLRDVAEPVLFGDQVFGALEPHFRDDLVKRGARFPAKERAQVVFRQPQLGGDGLNGQGGVGEVVADVGNRLVHLGAGGLGQGNGGQEVVDVDQNKAGERVKRMQLDGYELHGSKGEI